MNHLHTAALALIFSAAAPAATINIAFHNGATTVAAMTSRPDGAIVATSTDTWNNPARNGTGGLGLSFTGFALADSTGAATTATLDATSGFTAFNNNGWGTGTQDHVMMEGWYGFRDAEFLTVNNLPAEFTASGYTVTIFGDPAQVRTMDYFIAGSQQTIVSPAGSFSGTFTEGTNYVTFTGLSAPTLTITGNVASAGRSAVNGLVITSVPEPGAAVLLALGGLVFLRRRR